MTHLTLHFLGAPRIERDGEHVHVDTRKAYALLAYLALSDVPQSRDTLAALLWPEANSARARGALRRTLSVLNGALCGVGLDIERESVGLDLAALDIDVTAFEGHAHAGRDTQAAEAYTGDFLQGFSLRDSTEFDDWQYMQSERLRRMLASVLERLSATPDHAAALRHAERWLALDPLHEPAHRQLMRLYARTGQRSAALKQYRTCTRLLDEELGVEPLAETTALYQDIRDNPSDPPQSAVALEVKPHYHWPTLPALPLVGRDAELAELRRRCATGGQFIVLEGEAGIGKTRLTEALIELMRGAGVPVLMVTCYEGEANLPYAPFAALLPELTEHELPITTPAEQSRFFAAMHRALLARFMMHLGAGQGVLLIDNIGWADSASLELLAYMVRRGEDRSPSVLVTWRTEDVPTDHRLRLLAAERMRLGKGAILPLSRLTPDEVSQLARFALPGRAAAMSERLFRDTEGLPFLVAEYLALIAEGGDPNSLPPSVQDLMRSRLASVGEASRQILQAAAVIEHSFDFETLRGASGRGEDEVVDALDELARRGLIRELDGAPPHYVFYHEKLRAVAYLDMSHARRRLLHGRVAQTLVRSLREGHVAASRIAQHFELAGDAQAAATYFASAAEHARSLFANHEALAHYRSALALGFSESPALHMHIGDVHTVVGEYGSALRSYETALRMSGADLRAMIEHRIGRVYHRLGLWQSAVDAFEAAISDLEHDSFGLDQAILLADWSLTVYQRGDGERAQALAQQSLEAAKDNSGYAQAHNILGILARKSGDAPRARHHLEASLAAAETLEVPDARIAALNNLALVYCDSGDLDVAVETLLRALALCEQQGDRHRAAALHNNLADLCHAERQEARALTHLKQAAALFAEVGLEIGHTTPEIWKLTEW